jgi:hypothetical protein
MGRRSKSPDQPVLSMRLQVARPRPAYQDAVHCINEEDDDGNIHPRCTQHISCQVKHPAARKRAHRPTATDIMEKDNYENVNEVPHPPITRTIAHTQQKKARLRTEWLARNEQDLASDAMDNVFSSPDLCSNPAEPYREHPILEHTSHHSVTFLLLSTPQMMQNRHTNEQTTSQAPV